MILTRKLDEEGEEENGEWATFQILYCFHPGPSNRT